MRKGFIKGASVALALAMVLGSSSIYTLASQDKKDAKKPKTNNELVLQLMTVNDIHGQISSSGSLRVYGEKVGLAGPISILATYLDKAKNEFMKEYPDDGVSFRVQSGDMVGASEAASGLLQDEPTMQALSAMGFNLGTLGNHEFDEGLAEFNRIVNGEAPKKGQFLDIVDKYPHKNTNMEIVIANVVNKSDKKIPFGWKPYTVRTFRDKQGDVAKVGFIGIVTEEIPVLVLKKQWEDYEITNPAKAVNKYAKELKKQGVKAIVVLSHTAALNSKNEAEDLSMESAKIIDGLDKDSQVDIFVAGHNHVITNATYKGIRVVEGASHAKAFANVIAKYDTKTNDFSDIEATVVPALVSTIDKDGKTVDLGIKPNAKIDKIVKDAEKRIAKIVNRKIATADATISRTVEFAADAKEAYKSPANLESPLGNLITDGQLHFARNNGFKNCDFAITNNGGIRADLEAKDGVITWGAAQKAQPFGNVLQVIEISGKDLKAALNSQYDTNEYYFLQMSGLSYTYKEAPADMKDKDGNPVKYMVDKAYVVKQDGTKEEIKDNVKYVGVINDFLYGGGDGFGELAGKKLLGALDPDTEVFISYIQALNKVSVKTGDRKVYYADAK